MDVTELSPASLDAIVAALRGFSRKLVRELGFMRTTLAGTDLAPSAVHAVIEIGAAPGINARDLARLLRLDKSNTSRQLARLEARGYIVREPAQDDARSSCLRLTPEGQRLLARINQFATDQVSRALRRIVPADQRTLVRALALYAEALAEGEGIAAAEVSRPAIIEGYVPGCIGDIAGLHARFYATHWGFGPVFEKKVATELAAFASALPAEGKALWLCEEHGRVLASLAIDGDMQSGMAQLRWFIVDGSLRGSGLGRQLMERAIEFVDARFDETYLWTFQGLDAARHLYESFGFRLVEQAEGEQWGTRVVEQRFSRLRPPA